MSVRGSEQAVVTDFDEAFGQDVLKETADKLLRDQVWGFVIVLRQ